ncbi:MAG: sulfotransferase [Treponema sp.]
MSDINDFTIIGVTGFGESGSSAITNILEEFKCVSPLKGGAMFECKFFSSVLFQLETALKNQLFVNEAVKELFYKLMVASKDPFYQENFGSDNLLRLTNEYINSVCGVWLGGAYSERDNFFIPKTELNNFKKAQILFNKLYRDSYNLYEQYEWKPSFQQTTDQYFGKFTEDFYKKTQEYTCKLFNSCGVKEKFLLVDGLFRPEIAARELNWYSNAKFIIVDRDPRDLYILSKIYKGEPYIPTWNIDTYINWFKTYRSCNDRNSKYPDKILQLRFEDLIYKYEESLLKIKTFLGLTDEDHIKKRQIFIPEKSKTNTQVFRKHPEYSEDILKIEKELPEFCYKYTDDQIINFDMQIENRKMVNIEDVRKTAIIFQKTGMLPFSNMKAAFIFTGLISSFQSFKQRRTMVSKMKGLIKLSIGIVLFPVDVIYQFIQLAKYQRRNKNKTVEFK